MRSYEEIEADMKPGHTFSNMSGFEHWAAGWCVRCVHRDECPISDAAVVNTGMRPAEWTPMDGPDGPFRCSTFERSRS